MKNVPQKTAEYVKGKRTVCLYGDSGDNNMTTLITRINKNSFYTTVFCGNVTIITDNVI